jgi:hypothetical protein
MRQTDVVSITVMGVWQRVATNSLMFYLGLLCPALLRPAGWPPLKLLFQGWLAHRTGGLRLSSTPLDTQRHTPLVAVEGMEEKDT